MNQFIANGKNACLGGMIMNSARARFGAAIGPYNAGRKTWYGWFRNAKRERERISGLFPTRHTALLEGYKRYMVVTNRGEDVARRFISMQLGDTNGNG